VTAPPASPQTQPLRRSMVDRVVESLEHDFGRRDPGIGMLANQHLLDALDRGHVDRFAIWPGDDPVGVLYAGASGTVAAAGLPVAGRALAEAGERMGWRVLIGPESLIQPLLEATPRGFFRRRADDRQQRFMVCRPETLVPAPPPPGFRRATLADVDVLTEFACNLHVEDKMGPPVNRSARSAVRSRMEQSVDRAATWVVVRDGHVVAKVDVSLRSRRRGAQIAGVYVAEPYRGRGIAGDAVRALAADLIADGLAGVTLHVRADNRPGIAAYLRAGFADHGPLTLALR
jgi:uncharacterized protein